MADDAPQTTVGKALRTRPWLLAGVSLMTLVARFAIGGSDVPAAALVGIVPATIGGILLWQRRLTRQASDAGDAIGAAFSCSTTLQYDLVRRLPRLEPALRPVRLAWLVGGWLIGKLHVTRDGVAFVPNPRTRSICRCPTLDLPWREIEHVGVVDNPGPLDPGILELRLTDGTELAFMVNRQKVLAGALRELGRS